jgi:hypothetical protein
VSDTIDCRAGLKRNDLTNSYSAWVRSPRTGHVLTIGEGWWHELPFRLNGRIVAAMAIGKPAKFTPDELKALVALEAKIAAKSRPLPPGADRRKQGW